MARARSPFMDAPAIPCASVAPGRIHWYEIPAHWYAHGRNSSRGGGEWRKPKLDPERAAFRSRRNALDAAGWMWLASRPRWERTQSGKDLWMRQAMWTLTLPEPGPEPAARKALSSWLNWSRTVAGIGSYLWVAELTRRGRVHFHVVVNDYVDHGAAARAWLRACHREGLALGHSVAPSPMVRVDAIQSSGELNGYVSKYIGKDFGDRCSQLDFRMGNLAKVGADMAREGMDSELIPAALVDVRLELELHKRTALLFPRAVQRRWGASNDLERSPLQIIGADDPRTLAALHRDVTRMDGVRWGERSDKGQACYFDLASVTPENCPALYLALHDAAPTRADALSHNARGRSLEPCARS